jgi:hypothetical protein
MFVNFAIFVFNKVSLNLTHLHMSFEKHWSKAQMITRSKKKAYWQQEAEIEQQERDYTEALEGLQICQMMCSGCGYILCDGIHDECIALECGCKWHADCFRDYAKKQPSTQTIDDISSIANPNHRTIQCPSGHDVKINTPNPLVTGPFWYLLQDEHPDQLTRIRYLWHHPGPTLTMVQQFLPNQWNKLQMQQLEIKEMKAGIIPPTFDYH